VVLAVYIPPFAKARRMGHPGFWGWVGVGGLVVLAVYIPPFAKDGAPGRSRAAHGSFKRKGSKDGVPGVLGLVQRV
jgi:hypothetical protein